MVAVAVLNGVLEGGVDVVVLNGVLVGGMVVLNACIRVNVIVLPPPMTDILSPDTEYCHVPLPTRNFSNVAEPSKFKFSWTTPLLMI